ncbi:MAG: NACHT domain-containing protein [Anaerolineae bacterium]
MLHIIYVTLFYLAGPAPAPQRWRFDTLSALIGAGIAILLLGLAYGLRDELRLGWETIVAPLGRLYHRLQASAEDRYRELVATWARSLTVPAHVAPLNAVFVEPELLAPLPLPPSISEVEPESSGPRNLPLHRILGGHPKLAILGAPGMGKTTLLAYLALACVRMMEEGDSEAEAMLGSAQERLPLYVPLPALDWGRQDETEQEGKAPEGQQKGTKQENGDQVKKLLYVAVAAVGGGGGLIRPLRQSLEASRAIVLVDGWDELLPQQRQQAAAWLAELIAVLPGNLWLVGAGARGYAPLTEAGFVPLTLAPWNARQVEAFAERWLETCTPADGDSPVAPAKLIAELRRAARMRSSPLELALRAFVYLSDRKAPAKRGALFDRALDLLLWQEQEEEVWVSATYRTALGQLALQLQQEKRAVASREEIMAAIEATLPPSEERPANAAARAFSALTGERGLLRLEGSNRYAFVHPLWQAYLAARQLIAVEPTTLIEWLDDPRWAEVLRFYAELGDAGPLVKAWLRNPDDMFHTRLLALGSWVSVAPEDANWRDGVMAVLARTFLQPGQPVQVRQALAEALATTGVPGVTYLFKQTLQHPDAAVRAAAASGLTRIANLSDLPTLEAMLEDEDPAVGRAAVCGLAYLSTDAAVRLLEQVLLEGDDALRPTAAEALTQCGEQGISILMEAIESEDIVARRAAVFGLARVEALDVLQKAAREDEQWIVRSAAAAALEELEDMEKATGITPPPEIDQLPWLISWAATRGEGVGLGDAARHMLRRALSEGDTSVRLAAAQTLAQVGRPDDVELLRTLLTNPDPIIAGTGIRALAEISKRYDLRIE